MAQNILPNGTIHALYRNGMTHTGRNIDRKMTVEGKAPVFQQHFHLIDHAKAAAEAVGLTPVVEPIRGGTDGARLSFMGLPCPNLGTGGYAFHGPYEHITVEGMEKTVELLCQLVQK